MSSRIALRDVKNVPVKRSRASPENDEEYTSRDKNPLQVKDKQCDPILSECKEEPGNKEIIRKPVIKKSLAHRYNIQHLSDIRRGHVNSKENRLALEEKEYFEDIYNYLFEREYYCPIGIKFENCQSRDCQIIKWFYKMQEKFAVNRTLVHNMIRIYDVYVTHNVKRQRHHQLIAAAIFVLFANSDSETKITMKTMARECGGIYSKNKLLQTERMIYESLNFNIFLPSPSDFVKFYLIKLDVDAEAIREAIYLTLDCFTMSENFSTETPSKLAAAATSLCIFVYYPKFSNWNVLKESVGFYSAGDLQDIKKQMFKCVELCLQADFKFKRVVKIYEHDFKCDFLTKLSTNEF